MTETLLQAVSKERRIKLIAFLAALLLMFLVIIFIKNMLVSFLIAFVNYYLLSPAVDYLERSGNSRLKATLIPFVILSSLIIGGLILFSPVLAEQLKGLQNNIPAYTEAVSQFLSDL